MNNHPLYSLLKRICFAFALGLTLAVVLSAGEGQSQESSEGEPKPLALYLTWQQDPTSTMTIQWHTEGDTGAATVEYGPADGEATRVVEAKSHPMVFSSRMVHTVELTGLEPEKEYRFRISNITPGVYSPFYKFRTMPKKNHRPIRIAFGGDVRHQQSWMEDTNRQAARFDPDFIVWGGDLAYSNGREDMIDREYEFFDAIVNTLITDEGRVIPILTAIGNHEVIGGYYWRGDRGVDAYQDTDEFRAAIAPYFYNLHAFPGHPGYKVLDFGDYLSLIFLDSDHTNPIQGRQTEWLEQVLSERQNVPHVFPVYHFPAYPSVRDPGNEVSQRVREHWVPLFEKYGIRVAFEHHDHAYKRTVPILNGAESEAGIVYIGDGAWGVGAREPKPSWYLAKSGQIQHFILMTIMDDSEDLKMISREGKLFDHYIPRRR